MKTARGIYHNLEESEYTVTIGVLTFFFSSPVYRRKFIERLNQEVERFNSSINNLYKNQFNIDMALLAIVRLYQLIEKRGFYMIVNGEVITCQNDLEYVSEIRTLT